MNKSENKSKNIKISEQMCLLCLNLTNKSTSFCFGSIPGNVPASLRTCLGCGNYANDKQLATLLTIMIKCDSAHLGKKV